MFSVNKEGNIFNFMFRFTFMDLICFHWRPVTVLASHSKSFLKHFRLNVLTILMFIKPVSHSS